MDILLTGSVAYDYLMTFPGHFHEQILPERLASISLSFLVESMSKQRGGIAPNIAYSMALLGEKPRVILPRKMVDNIVPDTEPVEVDVRSFGVRMPPSTAKDPNYGVMGMLQVVPQSIAWLWRLISPRGFKNPSIADTNAGSGLKAEGVGSYWPFATGLKVTQANLLLEQIMSAPKTP